MVSRILRHFYPSENRSVAWPTKPYRLFHDLFGLSTGRPPHPNVFVPTHPPRTVSDDSPTSPSKIGFSVFPFSPTGKAVLGQPQYTLRLFL